MVKPLRKFVIVIAVAVFLPGSVNFFLYLHLAEHNHDAGHDHKNCPICQQAAVNKSQTVLLSAAVGFELLPVFDTAAPAAEHITNRFSFCIPYLRAPPSPA